MNTVQLNRRWGHFKGTLKQIEGNYEKLLGNVQARYAGKTVVLLQRVDAWRKKPPTIGVEKKAD
ncbi:MAG TPA: hypothetical protein VJT11_01840 [Nitrospiraceae bacterium]|nr:hypothetical protein [Nitrospiraceae bacterium]